jgi:hypothetical protein
MTSLYRFLPNPVKLLLHQRPMLHMLPPASLFLLPGNIMPLPSKCFMTGIAVKTLDTGLAFAMQFYLQRAAVGTVFF